MLAFILAAALMQAGRPQVSLSLDAANAASPHQLADRIFPGKFSRDAQIKAAAFGADSGALASVNIYERAQRLDEGLCLGVVHTATFAPAGGDHATPVRLTDRGEGRFFYAMAPYGPPFTADACERIEPRLFFDLPAGAEGAAQLTTLRQLRAGMDAPSAERLPFEVVCSADQGACPDKLTVIRELAGHTLAKPVACAAAGRDESCWRVDFDRAPGDRVSSGAEFVSRGGRLIRVTVRRVGFEM